MNGKVTAPQRIRPPTGLSKASKRLWNATFPRRGRSPEKLAAAEMALHALDRANSAREIIEREGLTVRTRKSGYSRPHPLIRVESDARSTFLRIWRQLSLFDGGDSAEGRPETIPMMPYSFGDDDET